MHAIITGATRGIGLSLAQRLAPSFNLTLVARDATRLSAVAAALPRAEQHTTRAGDIGQRSFWKSLLPSDDAARQRVGVLVNCAGIVGGGRLFVRSSEESIEGVVRTNLLGSMWGCKEVGRAMMRQRPAARDGDDQDGLARAVGRGVIVNVASLLAIRGGEGSVAYAASKAGVVGMTRALALELGPAGIRVNTVLPGYIDTDMTRDMTAEARDRALAKIPLGRLGGADEVADAVYFLIANAYAHNCVLNLDGGLSAVVRLCTS